MEQTRERALKQSLAWALRVIDESKIEMAPAGKWAYDSARAALALPPSPALQDNRVAREAIEAILSRAKAEPVAVTWHRLQECINEMAAHALAALDALPSSPQPPPVAAGEHTPGPWQAEGTVFRIPGNSREQAPANARLIAAAPDMLAALQKADEALQAAEQHVLCASGQELKEVTRGRARIRAAIARATGREG